MVPQSRFRSATLAVLAVVVACFCVPITAKTVRDPPNVSARSVDSGALLEPAVRMRYDGSPWDYEIRVALPPSYHKDKKSYPVLWVTDGSFLFEEAVGTVFAAAGLPEMIVVSVGVPPEARGDVWIRREFDFNATESKLCRYDGPGGKLLEKECGGTYTAAKTGGAAQFLTFLVTTVRQRISKDYRTASENTLFGYSSGGNFCTYALLKSPENFQNYICGSPAYFWDGGALFAMEQQYSQLHQDLKATVFLSAGEGEMLQDGIAPFGIVSSMARMTEILHSRRYPSLHLHARIFPGDVVHDGPGRVTALHWALRALSKGD